MSKDMEGASNWANQTNLLKGVRRNLEHIAEHIAERMRHENER